MRMTARKSLIALTGILLIFAVITTAFAALTPGKKAPDFTLKSITGKQVTLKQLRTDPLSKKQLKVILIDFWATWCPPCREEVPLLQKLHQKYSKKGLSVVGISVDDNGAEAVKPFAKEYGLKYNMLLDPTAKIAKKYLIRPIPTTYLIDKQGIIRYVHVGFNSSMEKQLEKEINELLK
ncbi:MAG: TlpA disulfide reductase family protein [Armatimonadota bacterium]